MNSEIEFTWEVARQIANEAVWQKESKYLSDIEVMVVKGAWDRQSYGKIAHNTSYQESYLNQDVGNKLWRKLTKALGERVTKTNFREALQRKWEKEEGSLVYGMGQNHRVVSEKILEYPDKPLRCDSPFYVERYNQEGDRVELDCYDEVLQNGALIRIRAPQKMGKTSLLKRILSVAEENRYRTVYLNLREAEREVFESLGKFLRWFAANVSLGLGENPMVDEHWGDNSRGNLISCKYYFQNYFLKGIETPLVLGLDNLDRIFEYPEIAPDFLGMLRSWHEEGNDSAHWKKFGLVIANSTEIYIKLDTNQSPFNVGFPVRLSGLNGQQVEDLAKVYGLGDVVRNEGESLAKLRDMVGGHPFLIQLALYHLHRRDVSLVNLLANAPTQGGIYGNHLRRHWDNLQQQSDLAAGMKRVVMTEENVRLEPIMAYKLESMGLVTLVGDDVRVSCDLYRQYFGNRL